MELDEPKPRAGETAAVSDGRERARATADGGPADGPAPMVTVRYWAAARRAAGIAEEKHAGRTVADVLDAARRAHVDSDRFGQVLSVCSLLLGEQPLSSRDPAAVEVASGDVIEVLPPFAGG